jgi:uncharacterized protein (TIGR02996 family)
MRHMKVAALEQTLRDRPGDLASWRAYGDWLRGQGDPRGTLIDLEQRRAHLGPADRGVLKRRAEALVTEHQPGWDAALPPEVTVVARRYGFATKVAVKLSDEAPALIRRALEEPFVTALRITLPEGEDPYEDDEEYGEDYDEDRLPPLVEAGVLAGLDLDRIDELDLAYLTIGEPGAALLASVASSRLTTLDLRYAVIGDAGLAALAASLQFTGVRRLHLQSNRITADGVRSLGLFPQLTELDLRYNPIGTEGAQALLQTPFISSLKRLLLYRDDITGEGARILAGDPRLPRTLRSHWRSV